MKRKERNRSRVGPTRRRAERSLRRSWREMYHSTRSKGLESCLLHVTLVIDGLYTQKEISVGLHRRRSSAAHDIAYGKRKRYRRPAICDNSSDLPPPLDGPTNPHDLRAFTNYRLHEIPPITNDHHLPRLNVSRR